MRKLDQQVEKELVCKYGLHFDKIAGFKDSLRVLADFAQYLGANQYFSDYLNKKVFLLNLDIATVALELEELVLRADEFHSVVKQGVLSKKKTALDAGGVKQFREKMAGLEKKLFSVQSDALHLTEEIRSEYKKKAV
ncbi:hypothetical protein H0N96_01375 [Candidatus Micrarchaeota archaeon]|nr:hypothetical protein [Candidatus Micrarchaeota archaeon]